MVISFWTSASSLPSLLPDAIVPWLITSFRSASDIRADRRAFVFRKNSPLWPWSFFSAGGLLRLFRWLLNAFLKLALFFFLALLFLCQFLLTLLKTEVRFRH